MKKLLKRFICLIMTIIIGIPFIVPISASNRSFQLNVPTFKQEKSQWCWVATGRMVGYYFYNTSRTQSDGVRFIKGSVVNQGGSIVDIRNVTRFFTHNNNNFYNTGVLSFSTIEQYINKYWPITAAIKWNGGGGHAVVIYGYIVGPKNPGGVRYIDPWDGQKHYTRYSKFLDGSYNGGKYYASVY